MASQNPPKKATAYTFPVSLVSQADTRLMQTSVTLAAGDITVSKDGGSFANIGTLPTEISTSGVLPVVLTSTEMDADYVAVRFKDASGAQWCDLTVVLQTVAKQFDDLATTTGAVGSVTGNVGGNVVGSVGSVAGAINTAAGTITTLDALDTAQDAEHDATQTAVAALNDFDPTLDTVANVTLVGTTTTNTDMRGTDSAATAANLATVAGYLDTEVAAILAAVDTEVASIKTVTDNLPDSGALTALLASIASILAATGTDGVVLSTATRQAIADELLARSVANVEDTAGDHTIAAMVLAAFESAIAGAVWSIYKTDGVTPFLTKAVTTDAAADPITGVE